MVSGAWERQIGVREMHTPKTNPEEDRPERKPEREIPEPPVPPDMEPVIPQHDPPKPGRGGDVPGEPPPITAVRAR